LIPDIHINTEVEAVATESSRIVRDLLNELDERSRLILKLYYFEDLSMREIAEMLGVTESNMSQIITRLIGYILKLLNQRGIYNIRDISC
jgi:RNA polymerase sigma factor for flagellar operon FliA